MRTSQALLLSLLAGAAVQAQAATYTFDATAQGWTVFDGGTLTHVAAGGNPGGFLQVEDINGGDMLLVAPAAALGDWSSLLNGTFSFDAKNLNGIASSWGGFGLVVITSGATSVSFDMVPDNNPPSDGQWHNYSVVLNSTNFGAALPAVLANVTGFTFKVESHDGFGPSNSEINGIDNVAFTSAVPEPASAVLLGLGLATVAWRRRIR
jgi:PEP-CTERM motif